jgi:hypothetical protein
MAARPHDILQPGDWVAHYTTTDVAWEHILPSGQLRMSPYARMRDPAENKVLSFTGGYWGEGSEAAWANAGRRLNEIRNGMRLLSLTEDVAPGTQYPVFGCCWARPRMWEQYADDRAGVCLVFHRESFEEIVEEQLAPLGRTHIGSVSYTVAGIAGSELRHLMDQEFYDDDRAEGAATRHLEEFRRDFFFLKTEDYLSEHERRVVLFAPDDEYAYVRYGDSLQALVLGEQFPADRAQEGIDLCTGLGIECRRAFWSNGRPFPLPEYSPLD